MSLQARSNPPWAGRRWLANGWRLVRMNPFGFAMLMVTFLSGIMLLDLALHGVIAVLTGLLPGLSTRALAAVGSMLIAILIPGLWVGFMEACKAVLRKEPVHPQLLFKGYAIDQATSRALLVLGVVYSVGLALALLIVTSIDLPPGMLDGGAGPPQPLPPEIADGLMLRIALAALVHLPFTLLLWYAPLLVAWHRLAPLKAMFFSLAACWRNRWAFLVYGVSCMVFIFGVSILGGLLRLAGLGPASVVVVMPMIFILVLTIYCSMYPSYVDVFVEEADPQPVAPASLGSTASSADRAHASADSADAPDRRDP